MKNIIPTIGIDLVEIDRFKYWHRYTNRRLRKLFSEREIAFCQSVSIKSAERFAARFAAKEALFKALAPYAQKTPPLFTIFKALEITTSASGAQIHVAWDSHTSILSNTNISHLRPNFLSAIPEQQLALSL